MRALCPLACALLVASMLFPIAPLLAQDMDTLEGIQRQQYEQLTAQQNLVQQQMDLLVGLKSQVDGIITQVSSIPSNDYNQEADRYRQIQLLIPSAVKYSQELAQRQKQIDQLQRQKADLRSQILARRSDLPIWWRE